MGKKYLLYIHEELFDKEAKKSDLVNNLLERHYHGTVDGGKTQEEVHEIIKTKQDAMRAVKKKVPGTSNAWLADIEDGRVNYCKVHGTPMTTYDKCLQKGCKYA
jgi:hypothetical protein